ncbi:uncharacterized protein LOC129743109 [Uranotaenia lowii]|uniref:uncharacterized protein LOC129743109 n=1 Tax=Uranotaenia lowii TaxID=190385 RepID=UPI00247B129A|nr:uncharacterized protein LOC129743109 [Uranotaenia lowii]
MTESRQTLSSNLATSIEPYRRGTSFSDWVERLGYCFMINKISDEDKKAHFITLAGPYIFTELKLLFPGPGALTEARYEQIVTALKTRIDKVDDEVSQRLAFSGRFQEPGESAEDYLLSLKLMAEFCNFEGKEKTIRDRLLFGVTDIPLKQLLIKEPVLTLSVAEKIIAGYELARKHTKMMEQSQAQTAAVGVVGAMRVPIKSRLGVRPTREPYRSDRNYGHSSNNFKRRYDQPIDKKRFSGQRRPDYDRITCTYCNRKGHLVHKCFELKNAKRDAVKYADAVEPEKLRSSTDKQLSEMLNRLRAAKSDSDSDSDTGDLQCLNVTSINRVNDPCLVNVLIEGKNMQMEIDCGSSVSVIGKKQYYGLFSVPLKKSSKQLIVVNGGKLLIEGEATVNVQYMGILAKLKLVVLNCSNNFLPLLGRSWLDIFIPNWRETFTSKITIQRVIQEDRDKIISDLKQKFSNVFIKDFSTPIKGFEADLVLKSDNPIFKKAYEVPYRLREKQMVPSDIDVEVIRSINFSKDVPYDANKVANETKNDKFLQDVIFFLRNGTSWKRSYNGPSYTDPDAGPSRRFD